MTMMMVLVAAAGIDLMRLRDRQNGSDALGHIAAVAARSMPVAAAVAVSATVARRMNRPSDPAPPRPPASHPNQNYHRHSQTPHYYFSILEGW